jgi:hypothetical protein
MTADESATHSTEEVKLARTNESEVAEELSQQIPQTVSFVAAPALCSEQIPHETRVILRALLYRYPTCELHRLWRVGTSYDPVRLVRKRNSTL